MNSPPLPSSSPYGDRRQPKRTKRCHGNRKLRRFRKKCRRRGMNEAEIQPSTTPNTETRQTRRGDATSKKRKRMATAVSSRSISQRLPKRSKNRLHQSMDQIVVVESHQQHLSKYLIKKPRLLFQMLRLHLNHSLKGKQQQEFIYRRLSLVDRQYRLDVHRHLWQSYRELGANHDIWPEHVYKKAKTIEHLSCLQFVKQHLINLNQQYEQCTKDLMEQTHRCPSALKSSLDIDDEKLKNFVQIQQKYWSFRMQSHLKRFQSIIQERNLYDNLSLDSLTDNERERIERLLTLKDQQWQIFQMMSKLELRVSIKFLPHYFDQLETFVAPNFYRPLVKNSIAIEFKQKRCKILQEVKRQWLMMKFQYFEKQYEHWHNQYETQLQELETFSSTRLYTNGNSTLYHSFLAYIKHHCERIQQEFFYEKLRFHRKKLQRLRQQRSKEEKKLISVSPLVMIDMFRHPFTVKEISYLSRGPSYIRPNQSSLQSKKKRIHYVNTTVEKYIRVLKEYMSYCKDRPVIPSTASIYKSYSDRLQKQLLHYYFNPLPLMDYLRARRESKWINSIRRKLRKYRLVLRETDKSSVLHIGRTKDYIDKAMNYHKETGAYEELTSNPFDSTFTAVVQLLNRLRSMNKIKECQKEKMLPKRDQVQLAYMYFLPKPRKVGTPLRPIINTLHTATTGISKFLDQLIRPLFDRFVRETTIVDGVDLLHRLHSYISKGYFTASTLFVTFDITNLYTMLPQEESLKILREFLNEYHCTMIDGISVDTIIELARLVLQNNTFVFEKKFYRQIIGGAMGSPFTLTLANIFMWKWQKGAILSKLPNNEVYGRYIDDVFFTWNQSESKVKELLDEANRYHINIKLDYQIGPIIPFLDILLTNHHGSLISSVYHKPSNEPSILSFLSDHPRHVFRNVIQTFLMRAIRYSSTYDLFNREKRVIRLMLLYNSYPSTYINVQFRRFFEKYLPDYSSLFLSSIISEEQFLCLRQILLVQPSVAPTMVSQRGMPINVASTARTTTCVPMVSKVIEERGKSLMERTMFVHCTHEARFFGLNRDIHTIHDSLFKDTPNGDIKLIVGHRNNHNLEFELSQKRPRPVSILYDPSKKREPKANQRVISSTS